MAQLSWGKPSQFQTAPSVGGEPGNSAEWTNLPIPKEDTLQLTPTEGQETVANEEGGDPVDARYGKTQYVLEWDEFVKKGDTPSFEDNDGVVAGEHALRIVPEDDECKGILIERCTIVASIKYTAAEGILRHYKAKALKPKTGKTVKEYTKTA